MRTHFVALGGLALAVVCAAGLGVAREASDGDAGLKERGLDATDITYLTGSFTIERPGLHRLMRLTPKADRVLARCKASVIWKSDMSDKSVSSFADDYTSIPGGLVAVTNHMTEEDRAAFRDVVEEFLDCYLDVPRIEHGLYVPSYALKAARERASQQ